MTSSQDNKIIINEKNRYVSNGSFYIFFFFYKLHTVYYDCSTFRYMYRNGCTFFQLLLRTANVHNMRRSAISVVITSATKNSGGMSFAFKRPKNT